MTSTAHPDSGKLNESDAQALDGKFADAQAGVRTELGEFVGPLPIGLCVASVPDGRIVWANSVFEEISGRPPDPTSSAENASESYQVYDRMGRLYPQERFPFSVVVRTGKPAMIDDSVIHRADGRKIFLRTYARPVFDAAGQLQQVSVAFVDITREVQAELERDSTAFELELALEHAPIIIWAVSREGDITLAHGAGLSAIEERVGPVTGKNMFVVFPQEDNALHSLLDRALRGESFRTVVPVAGAMLDTWVSPVRNTAGEITGASGVSHDVREVRQLEAVAMQSDKARTIGVLSASVAHEINNPLTYMLPCCDYLATTTTALSERLERGDAITPSELLSTVQQLSDDISVLRSGVQRIATIASDLRAFTHSSEDPPGPVDLSAVARSVLQLIGKEVTIRTHLVLQLEATTPALGHASRLIQVVLNLLTNAMQALSNLPRAAAKITVRTADAGDHILLDVADSGPGVPEAARHRIFEPFMTTKKQGEGTGLGLFVSRSIVEQHGGTLTIHTSPEGGALFRVRLCRHQAVSVPPPVASHPTAAPARASVLIIDDEVDVGRALVRQLDTYGHQAVWYPGIVEAVRQIPSPQFDVVFCDLMMPDVDGLTWHEYLVQQWPDLGSRLVVMTGGAFSPLAREFALQNADHLVEKPFDVVAEVRRRATTAPAV